MWFVNSWARCRTLLSADRTRKILILFVVGALIDWVLLDRWQIRGRVTDSSTGEGIADAWVLAEFDAKKPLVNPPIPPHPNHQTTYCMGSRLARTDARGYFSFDVLTFNRPSAEKHAFIQVFKSDWIPSYKSANIGSSILSWPPFVSLSITRGPGSNISSPNRPWGDTESQLSAEQFSTTSEILGVTGAISNQSCGHAGLEFATIAMNHALSIASTYDDRDHIRGACKYMRDYGANTLPRRISFAEKLTSGYHKRDWPFDCDNLPFKKPVPPEVLRVEAEVAAERRAHSTAAQQGS